MQLLSKEYTSFVEVARVLDTDAALSAEVLRMANSPLGGRYRSGTVMQALALLGTIRVKSLVLTLTVSKFLRRAAHCDVIRRCWRHNLVCAITAKEFSCTFDVDAEVAYHAGLMHDIGRLGLAAGAPEDYEKILLEASDTREAERRRFGLDHCEAGAWIARTWLLPDFIAEVAASHHGSFGEQSPLITIVQMACSTAVQLGYGVTGAGPAGGEPAVSDELADRIALTVNAIECEYGL